MSRSRSLYSGIACWLRLPRINCGTWESISLWKVVFRCAIRLEADCEKFVPCRVDDLVELEDGRVTVSPFGHEYQCCNVSIS